MMPHEVRGRDRLHRCRRAWTDAAADDAGNPHRRLRSAASGRVCLAGRIQIVCFRPLDGFRDGAGQRCPHLRQRKLILAAGCADIGLAQRGFQRLPDARAGPVAVPRHGIPCRPAIRIVLQRAACLVMSCVSGGGCLPERSEYIPPNRFQDLRVGLPDRLPDVGVHLRDGRERSGWVAIG